MGSKCKNSSLKQRKLVLQLYLKVEKYKKIGELLNMKSNIVGDIVRNEGRVASIKQKGRPKKLMTREERGILRKVKTKPPLSVLKLIAEPFTEHEKPVSAQAKQGSNDRVARKKPFISMRNRK